LNPLLIIIETFSVKIKKKNGRSGLCNHNAVCPIADAWRDQIRSAGALATQSVSRFCSGAAINNARQDGKQLFLTAAHCGTTPGSWLIVFRYQTFTCPRGGDRFLNYTVSGLRTVARHATTDFHLLEVVEDIGADYQVYLAGFNGVDTPSPNSVGIHHPSGDVKKWSYSGVPITHGSWTGGNPNTHWRVQPWWNGTTEPGSSGSPLFNNNKQIIGQLHGGSAACNNMAGYDVYGKVSRSWDIGTTAPTRLRDHLDPENTGTRSIDGRNLSELKKVVHKSQHQLCRESCSFFSGVKRRLCKKSCNVSVRSK